MYNSGMNSKKNRKIEYTNRVLTQALTDLVKEKPLSAITVKEVVERADINRSTFYVHFETLDDLVQYVEHQAAEAVINYIEKAEENNGRTEDMLDGLFTFVENNKDVLFWLIDDNVTGHAMHYLYTYCKDKYIKLWADDSLSEEDYECIMTYLFGGGMNLLKSWYRSGFQNTETIRKWYRRLKMSTLPNSAKKRR